MRTTRRNVLKGGGKAVAAAAVLSVATGVAGAAPTDDAALMQDVAGWHELQKTISASLAEREKREKRLPERFRSSSGVDPRGWQEYSKEFPVSVNNRLREYEPFYVRAGMGEIEDQLDALWADQDPITNRLMDARPVTLAGAIALASVWVASLGTEGDPEDDWSVKVTDAAKRSLADAERLAGRSS